MTLRDEIASVLGPGNDDETAYAQADAVLQILYSGPDVQRELAPAAHDVLMPPETLLERIAADGRLWRAGVAAGREDAPASPPPGRCGNLRPNVAGLSCNLRAGHAGQHEAAWWDGNAYWGEPS